MIAKLFSILEAFLAVSLEALKLWPILGCSPARILRSLKNEDVANRSCKLLAPEFDHGHHDSCIWRFPEIGGYP